MAYVEPAQVVTGQPITAAKWNQDVVDNTLALYNSPGVLLDLDSFRTVLQSENTLIAFSVTGSAYSEIYNSGVTVDADNNLLRVQVAGVYAILAQVTTSLSATTANNGSLYAQTNDGQVAAIRTYQHPAVGAGQTNYLNIMGIKKMAVGDYVQFYFRQNLVASETVTPSYIGMHWIGSGE